MVVVFEQQVFEVVQHIEFDEHQAELVTRVLELASKRYLLADRSKFGRTGLYRLAARGLFDAVISERRDS